MEGFKKTAMELEDWGKQHADEFLPYGTLYQEAEKA
jgi:hypothetical protein